MKMKCKKNIIMRLYITKIKRFFLLNNVDRLKTKKFKNKKNLNYKMLFRCGLRIGTKRSPFCSLTQNRYQSSFSVDNVFKLTDAENSTINTHGWVQTVRTSKNCSFIEINDGSTSSNLQIVVDNEVLNSDQAGQLHTGASIKIDGNLVYHYNKKMQTKLPEIHCTKLEIVGESSGNYPIQKKYHSNEFLREKNLHLRARTRRFAATMRIRSQTAHELQNYLHKEGIYQIHTPIITSSDCEGSGELFEIIESKSSIIKEKKEEQTFFFNKPAFLGVSGQLHVECFACAMGKVYTFGPTFRAEKSQTQQHLAEFWMLEPEITYATLDDCVNLTKNLITNTIDKLVENKNSANDLQFLIDTHEKIQVKQSYQDTLLFTPDTLNILKDPSKYQIISYDDAIQILSKHSSSLSTPVDWLDGLTREHELFLVHNIFEGKPVFVLHYPTEQKAFYMKKSKGNDKTVACMDLLFPIVGEVAGGSEREDSYDVLTETMKQRNIGQSGDYDWYLDLRKYGSVPHAGFGLGFERLLQVLTCTRNIKDVIPMPRAYQTCSL